MNTFNIMFYPDNTLITTNGEENLLELASKAKIFIKSSCGGNGSCSQCKMIIKNGKTQSKDTGNLTQEELESGYILACQTYPESDLEIEIPESSRLTEHQVLVSEDENSEISVSEFDPLFSKITLELSSPTLDDHEDDVSRLYAELYKSNGNRPLQMGLEVMQTLPEILRKENWKITASLAHAKDYDEIVNIEPGWNYKKYYGMAVDIGTTTVVAYLVDLETGNTVSSKGTYNKQSRFGDDVISRIIYAVEEKDGLTKSQGAVLETINELIEELIKDIKISQEDIWYVTCAGNPTMIHLFLGINPEYIRLEPYVPVSNFFSPFNAGLTGIKINPRGKVYCLPGVASYVGADTTAGAKTIGINEQEQMTLFIDVGTNGELVLGNNEFLITCACSAGPAFEGVGLKHGMRAMEGAIENIRIMPAVNEVYLETIGDKKPLGICGSGLISCIAALKEANIIDRGGVFQITSENDRIISNEGEKEFILVFAEHSGTGKKITISESEIKTLIHSKAAIFAGIETMLKMIDMPVETIEQVYIAGGFGKYINLTDAIQIGMLPELPMEKYKYIGNSSISGAKMTLLSKKVMTEVEQLAQKMTYLELSTGNDFMEEFISASFIPHTDLTLFPTIA